MEQDGKHITAEEIGQRLGCKVAEYRKKKGMTQALLAEIVGVDSETISRFERGTALPSLMRLFEIACALDVGIGALLTEISPIAKDVTHSLSATFDEVGEEDRALLVGIAELMKKRQAKSYT